MEARDVMSSRVITVHPRTPVMRIAVLLREHRFGGVPVLHNARLVGIVTEKDLLHRHEIGTDRCGSDPSWWRRVVGHTLEPDWYVKSHGKSAEHVMTRTVVTAAPGTSLRGIAALFDTHQIGRVPIVEHDRLIGIVTGADLVHALARRQLSAPEPFTQIDDAQIRRQLLCELASQPWWNNRTSDVLVEGGVVAFNGLAENDAERQAARVAAQNVIGVRRVRDDRLLASEVPMTF